MSGFAEQEDSIPGPAKEVTAALPQLSASHGVGGTVSSGMPLLEIRDLSIAPIQPKGQPEAAPVIDGVNLRLEYGQIALLCGRSGFGKTLLFKAVLGLLPRDEWSVTGSVKIQGVATMKDGVLNDEALTDCFRRSEVGAVFQTPNTYLHPSLSVRRQIDEVLERNSGVGDAERDMLARLDAVGLNRSFADRRKSELSGGQQQRVLISFVLGSVLILADEPTSSLHEKAEREIIQLLADLRSQDSRRGMLIITHNPRAFTHYLYDEGDEQLKTRDCIFTLERLNGSQTSTLNRDPTPVSHFESTLPTVSRSHSEESWLLEATGVAIDLPQRWTNRSIRVVDDLTFRIRRGGLSYVMGPSGCGKTTLAKAILGLQPCSKGQILLHSYRCGTIVLSTNDPSLQMKVRPLVQMVFQDSISTFNPRMTLGETLREIVEINRSELRLSGFSGPFDSGWSTEWEREERLKALIASVGFSTPDVVLSRFPSEFSGGECQRLGIARALLLRPELVIADEPFANQDEETAYLLAQLFLDIASETDVTFLVISHDRHLLGELCHGGIEFEPSDEQLGREQ